MIKQEAIFTTFFAPQVRRGTAVLRQTLWLLHFPVVALAVFSLFTNRYDLWLDLRTLGPLSYLITIPWVLATLAIPFLAGPRLTGFFHDPRWVHPPLSAKWALRLLWPTYIVLAFLLINTCYFWVLWYQGRTDFAIPLPLIVGVLLGAWMLATRAWIRAAEQVPPKDSVTRWTHVWSTAAVVPVMLLMAGAFLVHQYQRPPTGPVDLAVVLGGHVLKGNIASVTLRDRVLVAVDLYKRQQVRHILLSGGIYPSADDPDKETNEVMAMKQVCLENGIPEDAISLDPVGVNTRATAYDTRRFMEQNGYQTVVACSSDYHLYRTAMAFREAQINASTLAWAADDWQCANATATLREVVAVVVYKFFPDYRPAKAVTMNVKSPRLEVIKSAHQVRLFDGPVFVKSYPCITGIAGDDKVREGDKNTPEGTFRIVYKNPESQFHLSLGLDYPNEEDAARGLKDHLISQEQYDGIMAALKSDLTKVENQKKLWYTPLGGEIFLHGHANNRVGTAGCVAVSDEDIEELYELLPLGTQVTITN